MKKADIHPIKSPLVRELKVLDMPERWKTDRFGSLVGCANKYSNKFS